MLTGHKAAGTHAGLPGLVGNRACEMPIYRIGTSEGLEAAQTKALGLVLVGHRSDARGSRQTTQELQR